MDEGGIATAQTAETSLNTQPPAYGPANMDPLNWALVPSNVLIYFVHFYQRLMKHNRLHRF